VKIHLFDHSIIQSLYSSHYRGAVLLGGVIQWVHLSNYLMSIAVTWP
jgi:hypothetical protein